MISRRRAVVRCATHAHPILVFAALLGLSLPLDAQEPAVRLELVPIAAGFRECAFGSDRAKSQETAVYKAAAAVGIDLPRTERPLIQLTHANGRAFHLFYNVASVEDSKCPLLVQRVHKRIINVPPGENAQPEVTDTYLVEAFKCSGGQIKRPDQHFGMYPLGKYARRTIEKTFETGIPIRSYAKHDGKWPFDPRKLYEEIAAYGPSREAYDAVRFERSIKWTMTVAIDAEGSYSFAALALGIRSIADCPPLAPLAAEIAGGGEGIELRDGAGLLKIEIGKTNEVDLRTLLGAPLRIDVAKQGNRTLNYPDGLAFNFLANGPLNTIIATSGFAGRTSKGVRLGDTRQQVVATYGERKGGDFLLYDGAGFGFTDDQVTRVVVIKGR
jgi:hypothetical protein